MNDDKLIEYLFHLCTDAERADIDAKLTASPDDRARLELLKAKLAQLDLVKEDVRASEQLITDTLRRTRLVDLPPRISPWPRWLFVSASAAAAAALVVAVLPRPNAEFATMEQKLEQTSPAVEGYEVTIAQAADPFDELAPLPSERVDDDPVLLAANEAPAFDASNSDIREVESAAPAEATAPAAPALTVAVARMDLRTLGLTDHPHGFMDKGARTLRVPAAKTPSRGESGATFQDGAVTWRAQREYRHAVVMASNAGPNPVMVQLGTNDYFYLSPNNEKVWRVQVPQER